MPNKVFIFHFLPIENYPPILNLLSFLDTKTNSIIYTCITTNELNEKKFSTKKSKILRIGNVNKSKIITWYSFVVYNFFSIFLLIIYRPKTLLYYETFSSFAPFMYKRFINKNANILIHNHEYVTQKEYKSGSIILRYFHFLEQKLYKSANWISHTNKARLDLFLRDNDLKFEEKIHHVIPNYPSKNWGLKNEKWEGIGPLKFIFIGFSVAPKSSYIIEFIDYLKNQNQEIIFDIYCLKKDNLPIEYLEKTNNLTVNIFSRIDYFKLPSILKNYHIGVILYKGLIPNFVHNAPNKLFEYLACDLDVWFPIEMVGCYPYENEKNNPKVLKIDFKNLEKYKFNELTTISELEINKKSYFYETIYEKLFKKII